MGGYSSVALSRPVYGDCSDCRTQIHTEVKVAGAESLGNWRIPTQLALHPIPEGREGAWEGGMADRPQVRGRGRKHPFLNPRKSTQK